MLVSHTVFSERNQRSTSDYRSLYMPGMTGEQLAEKLKARNPLDSCALDNRKSPYIYLATDRFAWLDLRST